MLNPMEFGGFVIRRIAIRMLYPHKRFVAFGGFAIRQITIPYFLTLNL